MSLKDDIELVEKYGKCGDSAGDEAWERIKTALEPLLINDTAKPAVVDSTPVYRCKCGFEWRTTSERDQYCPKCNEKMDVVK